MEQKIILFIYASMYLLTIFCGAGAISLAIAYSGSMSEQIQMVFVQLLTLFGIGCAAIFGIWKNKSDKK